MKMECVHCTSEEEYLFVEATINYTFHARFNIGHYECIYWKDRCHGSYRHALEGGDVIHTFEKWCKLTGNYPEWEASTTDDLSYLKEFLIKNEIT